MEGANISSNSNEDMESVLRLVLDTDARLRLNNIRVVNPEMYAKISQMIVNMYNSGRIVTKINDDVLKQMLAKINTMRREIKITRK